MTFEPQPGLTFPDIKKLLNTKSMVREIKLGECVHPDDIDSQTKEDVRGLMKKYIHIFNQISEQLLKGNIIHRSSSEQINIVSKMAIELLMHDLRKHVEGI